MAELADALDLGSSGATRTGSIPARCTNLFLKIHASESFLIYYDHNKSTVVK